MSMIQRKSKGIVFLVPAVACVIVIYGLIVWVFIAAMTEWRGILWTPKFIGLKAFRELMQLDRFWVNVRNNGLWLAVFIMPTAAVGFVLAYLLSNLRRVQQELFRQVLLFPMALSFVVTGTLWAWIYNPTSGVLNSILGRIGVNTSNLGWIAMPKIAVYCMIVAACWQYTGFALVLYLGAINGFPTDSIEAARLDGASHFVIMIRVVLPNVSHATLICTTMLAITTVKVFDLVYVMTLGGPGVSTEVLPYLMYSLTFSSRKPGLGAATSVFILLMSAAVVIPYSLWMLKKWVRPD